MASPLLHHLTISLAVPMPFSCHLIINDESHCTKERQFLTLARNLTPSTINTKNNKIRLLNVMSSLSDATSLAQSCCLVHRTTVAITSRTLIEDFWRVLSSAAALTFLDLAHVMKQMTS